MTKCFKLREQENLSRQKHCGETTKWCNNINAWAKCAISAVPMYYVIAVDHAESVLIFIVPMHTDGVTYTTPPYASEQWQLKLTQHDQLRLLRADSSKFTCVDGASSSATTRGANSCCTNIIITLPLHRIVHYISKFCNSFTHTSVYNDSNQALD